ncbi:MAG: efflux transporter outer membrane subunit [Rudaea sp.]|uniref:efflux transporter outer membrane subunit n=1 Tax=unclassified Rudaea TaxID=2627037 RepID=UPI0010F5FD41|nr:MULTISPECIES: efflux transporter outer membrane subunit [unclassified Rudaea]MBN8886431.1 efflux transporter outer membrane subunit [Rudaea sp.]
MSFYSLYVFQRRAGNPRSRLLVALAATALLAGCAAGRDDIRPSVSPLDAERLDAERLDAGTAVAAAATDAGVPAPHEWWKDYADAQLDRLVAIALEQSPDLQIAAARIRRAQGDVDIVHAADLPALDASASIASERFSNNYGWGPYGGSWNTNNQILAEANYRFDFWGKRRAQTLAAAARMLAGRAEARDAALLLQTSLVDAYLRLDAAYRLRELAGRGLDSREQWQRLLEAKRGAGLSNDLDAAQLRIAVNETREAIAQLDGEIDRLRRVLAALAGKDPAWAQSLAPPQPALAPNPAPASRLPARLLGERPDVAAARARVEAAARGIDAAKAAFYPDVDLSVFAGLQRLGLRDFASAGSFAAGIVPAISLPIFDGGRRRGELTTRTAEYEAAAGEYNAVLLHALQDVADAVSGLAVADRQRTLAQERAAEERRRLALQEMRARAQLASRIDLLGARIATLLAERDATTAELRVATSQVALIRALGGAHSSHPL